MALSLPHQAQAQWGGAVNGLKPNLSLTAGVSSTGIGPNSNQTGVSFNTSYSGPTEASRIADCGAGTLLPALAGGKIGSTGGFTCAFNPGADYLVTVASMGANGTVLAQQSLTVSVKADGSATTASAGGGGNLADKLIGGPLTLLINTVLGVLFALFHGIFMFLMASVILPITRQMLMIRAADISSTVTAGWTICRDIVNMMFILVLIVIGLATILRVESYNYKRLLGLLVVMALLVNFSLVIGQAIIQMADVLTNTFISPLTANNLFDKLAKLRGFEIFSMVPDTAVGMYNSCSATITGFNLTVRISFITLVELIILATFVILAALLVVRAAVLWVLLILSPFAYVLAIIPKFKGLSNSWWTNFIRYAFFAPIMAFFLYLVLNLPPSDGISKLTYSPGGGCAFFNTLVQSNLNLIVIIVLLLAGMKIATKMSIWGATALVAAGTAIALMPLAAGKWGAKKAGGRIGQAYNQWTATKIRGSADKVSLGRGIAYAAMNPVAFFRGWGQRAEENKKRAQEYAALGGREVVEQMWSGGKKVVPRRARHAEMETDSHVKDFSQQTVEQMVSNINRIAALSNVGVGGGEMLDNLALKRAGVLALFGSGRIDDASMGARGTLKQKMEEEGKKMGMSEADLKKYKDSEGNFAYDTTGLTRQLFYRSMFGDNKEAIKMVAEQGEIAGKATEHYEYMKDGRFNPDANNGQGEHEYSGIWVAQGGTLSDGTIATQGTFDNAKGNDRYKNEISKMTAGKLAGESWISARGINMKEVDIDEVGLKAHFTGLKQRAFQAQDRNAAGLFYGKNTVDRDKIWGNGDLHALKYDQGDVNYEYAKKIGEIDPVAAAIYHEKLTTGKAINAAEAEKKAAKGFDIVQVDSAGNEVADTRHTIKSHGVIAEGEPHYQAAVKAVDSEAIAGEHRDDVAKTLDQKTKDIGGEMPHMNDLITAIERLNTGVNKTQAAGISQDYLERLATKKAGKVDYTGGLAAMAPDLMTKLAPQELLKLQDAVAKGVKSGLTNGANLANSAQKRMAFNGEVATAINKIADELPRVPELKNANKVNDLADKYYEEAKNA